MQNRQKYLLMLMLFITTAAYSQNEMRVVGKGEYLPSELIDKTIVDANSEVCAGLLIKSDLTGFTYDSNNGVVDMKRRTGEDLLFLSPGERQVKIYCGGFAPLTINLYEYGIKLTSGQVWQLKVTGEKLSDQIPISILVQPADAALFLDGVQRKSEPSQLVTTGQHELRIEKEGYKTITEKISVSVSNILFSYKLEAVEPIVVNILSEPPQALLMVNNIEKGETPKGLFLSPGEYKLKLTKAGYLDTQEILKVSEEGKKEFKYTLTKNAGTLDISVVPNDAVIEVDHNKIQSGVNELKPGTYHLRISKQNYFAVEDTVTIALGKRSKKNYELMKSSGILQLSVEPDDASVYLNNELLKERGKVELNEGKYKLEVKAENYAPVSEIIEIKANNTIEKKYSLAAKTGNLQLNVNVFNAAGELKRDGKIVKTWTGLLYEKGLLIGEYELTLKSAGYKTKKDKVVIAEDKTTVKEIELVKGRDVAGNMVLVEGGTFEMGSNNGESDEKPVHSVTIKSFYIGKYEVTQKEWVEIMGTNPSYFKGDNLPVECVSWNDVQEYISKLNAKTGGKYRLPTEAEWEYAARGGNQSKGYTYSGSNTIDDVAWYYGNSNSKTHEVGTKGPNELGIYDMSGNVWEWCSDWNGESYYSSSPGTNPQGPTSGTYRVLRGGSWLGYALNCRSSVRVRNDPDLRNNYGGFRIAQDL